MAEHDTDRLTSQEFHREIKERDSQEALSTVWSLLVVHSTVVCLRMCTPRSSQRENF